MKRPAIPFVVLALLVLAAAQSDAQRSTERYIPIGQSPGLSGKFTIIGTVTSVDPGSRTLDCAYESRTVRVRITADTRIWLDRSRKKLTNLTGSFGDCVANRRIEVKFVNNEVKDGGEADWIKVDMGG